MKVNSPSHFFTASKQNNAAYLQILKKQLDAATENFEQLNPSLYADHTATTSGAMRP